jgi:ApbE superfamily uncharacterized protein (UPF0280 family)
MSDNGGMVVWARSDVSALTHQDPIQAMSTRLGNEIDRTMSLVKDLERALERLDEVTEQLRGKGVTVEVDLGEVGNAARSARKVQAMASPRRTFSFPA